MSCAALSSVLNFNTGISQKSQTNQKVQAFKFSSPKQSNGSATRYQGFVSLLVCPRMRLHSLIPTISSHLVSALEDCGIKTDTDLLFFDGSNIDILAKLPPGIVSLREFEEYTSLVAEHASAPATRGDQELETVLLRQDENAADVSCGVQELDALVGGFGGGRVFEISGEKGSGKTVRHRDMHCGAIYVYTPGVGATNLAAYAHCSRQYICVMDGHMRRLFSREDPSIGE